MKVFRNDNARYVATYAIAAAQIGSGVCSTDVLVDDTTNVLESACLWEKTKENCKLGILELIVRNIIMSFSIYYYLVKGATYRVGFSKQIGGLLNSILVILYGVCTLWVIRFLFEFFAFGIGYVIVVIKGDGFISQYEEKLFRESGKKLGKRCNHLSMIGTMATSRGQGIGTKLMQYTLATRVDDNSEVVYDYSYLESSNPQNVPFYQRNGFVIVGEMMSMGNKVTFMVRKKRKEDPNVIADVAGAVEEQKEELD